MAESSSQETEWEAIEILKERGGKYYIRWAGIDPETNKAWKPTWEPKRMANELLVDDWKEKKKKKRKRRSSGRNSYRSESISYWSSTHSTTAKTTAELTRTSTRLSILDNPHSTPSSSSIISTKRKRRKTHETSTPASPVSSKLHSIHDHQSSPQPSTPSQHNSSQKLKQTVIPETQSQSDEELDTGNQKTQTNPSVNPNQKTPNRFPMTSSSLPENPLQAAKNSLSKRKQKKPGPTPPANPTPKTPIRLPLTSSSLPEEPIREAEDSISKRKQKKLKPNPPAAANPNPKTPTRDHLSPYPTQDPPEPAEDSDGPATPTQETSQAQDIALNLFSNDSSSHQSSEVEDEYSNLGQARTPNRPSPLLSSNNDQVIPSYEPDAETADLIASLNDYDDPDHLSRMVQYISRSPIDADDKRFILKFINDPLSYLAGPTNEIEQLRQEHTLGGYLGFEIKRQKAGSINLWLQGLGGSHPSWVVRWDSAKNRKKVAKLLFRYLSSRKRSCSDTSESRVSERTDAKPEPSHLSKDPNDHQSCSSQSHEPQESEIKPDPLVPDDNPAPFDDNPAPFDVNSAPLDVQESESSELLKVLAPSPPANAPTDAPPDDMHTDAPPDDIHTDAQLDNIHTDAPADEIHTDAPFDEIHTETPLDKIHVDPALPLSTGLLGELQPDTAIPPEDKVRPSEVEPLLNKTAAGEGRSEVEPLSNRVDAAVESRSQIKHLSIKTDTDREDRMSKEELRGVLTGLRVLLKGALEASSHQENNAHKISRLQADLEKEKETVAELKNRLWDRDGEITGRQADLEKEKETVAELKNRLQDQDAEITRQQALQADLKKQNEITAAELNNRVWDQGQKSTEKKEKQKGRSNDVGCMKASIPVSALDLCSSLSASEKRAYNQGLEAFLEKKGNRGRAGMDFGSVAIDIITRFLNFLPSVMPYIQENQVDVARSLSAKVIMASKSKDFADTLRCAPGLIQVSYPDPFWNQQKVKFETIWEAASEDDAAPTGSWQTLLCMFARGDKDNTSTYTDHSSRKLLLDAAFTRVDQLVKDSIAAVTGKIQPQKSSTTDTSSLDGIRKAEVFLHQKVQGYGGTRGKGASKNYYDTKNFLLKRIHQVFLALSLCMESTTVAQLENEYKNKPNITAAQLKEYKSSLQSNAIFRTGPPDISSCDWSISRRESYAVLASFMAFGVAGLFTSFINYRRYTLADSYGILTFGDQRIKAIKDMGMTETSSHPLVDGAWKYLNGHILKLLHASNIQRGDSNDWFQATKLWAKALAPEVVGEIVLADVWEEINIPAQSITSRGNEALHPLLDQDWL
ncbi:hypothetical protein PGTUg99_022012 [Puccinia graminis f. sp. tritici]|uniref:Chromo domain-containing protein n=1 Tax=Puccinia graminis f. sp. tritici TaxID=56615 RepID=A0A5B0RUP6_PUCGR|nr:hypothetical protein PGTUg99_022012 [Puccinia graminis f. sp. tritici]